VTDRTHPDYRRKIKTREALRDIIGSRPRQRSVIMCHGTFDLVHPGHVRHLMYAKTKADILIASLTSDAHIVKGAFRPFVPQDLRAMNLAALEIVDYVIIDPNPTPLENIGILQPDYFAKGYEYFKGGMHPKTREEADALAVYGGELLFTPGDVVYSSSAVVELEHPDIAVEKLMTLMESEKIDIGQLKAVLGKFDGIRVHVVGDTIVDSYVHGSLISAGSGKTPTISIKHERQIDFAGGAAVVAKSMAKAGATVQFSTVLGDDRLKDFVLDDLAAHAIDCRASIDHTRPTTNKTVFLANDYHMLKVDRLDNRPISDRVVDELHASLVSSTVDAFVLSDFRHGIFNRSTIPAITASLPAGALRAADSQVASRWGNILEFQGFDLITPNEREARFALGDQDSVVRPLALELYRRAQCRTLILKAGERGILTYRAPSDDVGSFFTVDSFAEHVVDPVGAGDALLSYATLSLVATQSPVIASILGSMAAAVACERRGNNPVTAADVLKKLEAVERRIEYA
jgi:rfaE bifunctional protein kinase chain/domain